MVLFCNVCTFTRMNRLKSHLSFKPNNGPLHWIQVREVLLGFHFFFHISPLSVAVSDFIKTEHFHLLEAFCVFLFHHSNFVLEFNRNNIAINQLTVIFLFSFLFLFAFLLRCGRLRNKTKPKQWPTVLK